MLGSVTNTSGGGTTYAIPLDITAVQAAVGQQLSLAIDSSGGDAFYIGSRESTASDRLTSRRSGPGGEAPVARPTSSDVAALTRTSDASPPDSPMEVPGRRVHQWWVGSVAEP